MRFSFTFHWDFSLEYFRWFAITKQQGQFLDYTSWDIDLLWFTLTVINRHLITLLHEAESDLGDIEIAETIVESAIQQHILLEDVEKN